jgi:pimeloyl-ACP methyl ester carboxylesterase
MRWRFLASSGVALGALILLPMATSAAPVSCAQLQTFLQAQPNVQSATTTLTTTGSARCEANFIYSSRGGTESGYADGQSQRIVLRVGLPLNSVDGGTGGVQGAWNGKVQNLGGGGLVGNVGGVTNATNAGYVGSSTDSGHTSAENPNFAVIQDTHQLNYGKLDDFLIESLRQQYQWALLLAETYFGMPATRNYWNGCSTGGRQGLSLALNHGDAFDGFLVGAPANYNSRLQVTTLWPWWVNREVAGNSLTTGQRNAANAAAVASCDAADGVVDGILSDPRKCKFDASANICGEPGAPAAPSCLTPEQAQAMNMIWDGPRNDSAKRIWFPFGRGANESVSSNSACGNLGSQCWAHRDTTFSWIGLPLSQFDDETQLATTLVAPYSDIMSVKLDKAKNKGAKILMWHGGADPLIPWRQAVHYYTDAISEYGGTSKPERGLAELMPWFRFFLAPGVGHCGGGVGPQPQNLFNVMVNWVETGVAPDSILASGGGRTRPLCRWPQTAIYNGTGDTNDAANFTCGGNLETDETICDSLITKFQKETHDSLQTVGYRNQGKCHRNEHAGN